MCKGVGTLGADISKEAFTICKHLSWGLGTPRDVEEQVSGRASPAGAAQGHWSPESPRRDLRTRDCSRAQQSSPDSTSRPPRGSAGGGPVHEDSGARCVGRGGRRPVPLQPAAPGSSRPSGGVPESEGTGSPAPRLLSATPSRAPKGREKGGEPRGGLRASVSLRGPGYRAALALPVLLCAAFASLAPELARDRGGAGGR